MRNNTLKIKNIGIKLIFLNHFLKNIRIQLRELRY